MQLGQMQQNLSPKCQSLYAGLSMLVHHEAHEEHEGTPLSEEDFMLFLSFMVNSFFSNRIMPRNLLLDSRSLSLRSIPRIHLSLFEIDTPPHTYPEAIRWK